MRVIVGVVAALAVMGAASQAAAQVTGTVDITGSVEERCEFTIDSGLIALGELSGTGGTLDVSQVNGRR
jgi:type 1 fimbria pilin